MPIHDCPLTKTDGDSLVAYLPITIVNPHTGKRVRTQGLIDTGADECSIPSGYAKLLGHRLYSGKKTIVTTGKGKGIAWAHTTKILIHHPETGDTIYETPIAQIDYIRGLPTVLLGVKSFLRQFIVTFNYPRNTFSLERLVGP